MASATTASTQSAEAVVDEVLKQAAVSATDIPTKGGWCLRQGLIHIVSADGGRLQPLVKAHGPPTFYQIMQQQPIPLPGALRHEPTEEMNRTPKTCFESLCRIVAGQQLAGKAALAIWNRLLETTGHGLTPTKIINLASDGLEVSLQKPAGLSKAKARSILDLAQRFDAGELSAEFLETSKDELAIREALLQVKGLGPWSVDMFLMFYQERANVFPFGDLGVRKGFQRVFELKGKGNKGSLCQKKDLERSNQLAAPYEPYQSLLTYYMWRAADVKDVYDEEKDAKKKPAAGSKRAAAALDSLSSTEAFTSSSTSSGGSVSTPTKKPARKRKARAVTP